MDAYSSWEYAVPNLSNQAKFAASPRGEGGPATFPMAKCSLLDHLVDMNPLLEGVELSTLSSFDTIRVRTVNSEYRMLLLDPKQGCALVEGGPYFAEPIEATLTGSTFGGSTLKVGWIGVGLRLEIWTNGKWTRTSPVQSILVTHSSAAEACRTTTISETAGTSSDNTNESDGFPWKRRHPCGRS